MTYNTNNPVPSVDVRDLYDNAQNLDNLVNGPLPAYADRLGVSRKSYKGMELEFAAFLAASGFELPALEYVDGSPLVVARPTQLIERGGMLYSVKATESFPATLTGTWATDQARVVLRADSDLRQDLANNENPLLGSALSGRSNQVVGSVAALRNLAKTTPSKNAFLTGYYEQGDGGGGAYYLDAADTTSADNGGTIIVAADGGRWKLIHDGFVYVDQFGARGDGVTNDSPAIQAAMDWAITVRASVRFLPKTYALGVAGFPTTCVVNPGVSLVGSGALKTIFVPVAALASTVDYITLQPPTGVALDWLEFRNFIVFPGASGTKRGRRAIVVNMDATSNASSLTFDGVYLAPGNDYSFVWVTNSTNNLQGGPANSVFTRNHFWEGVQLVNHGDSISFKNNVFRSSVGSGRPGLTVEGVSAAGGQPAQLTIECNNFDCDGGAIWLKNGLSTKIIGNNIEQSHGTGTSSGAVIDVDGNANRVGWCEVSGNNFGVFGTANVGQVVRVNNAGSTKLRDNRILSASGAVAARAILITASATDTEVFGNELSANFPQTILDNGVGTKGVGRLITPLNGFSNTGSGAQPLTIYKATDDSLALSGILNCPAGGGSGVLIGSIPAGFRYPLTQGISMVAIAGGVYIPARLTIETNGNIIFFATTANATQIFISANYGGLGFVTGDL